MPDAVCLGPEEAELLMPLLSAAAVVGIFGTFEINISFNTRQCAFLLFPVWLIVCSDLRRLACGLLYTLRRPVMREVLSTRIWGVPPACLGSR